MSDWISVKDRLPETFECVLASTDDGKAIAVAEFTTAPDEWFDRSGILWDQLYSKPVAYWQPLPEPPK